MSCACDELYWSVACQATVMIQVGRHFFYRYVWTNYKKGDHKYASARNTHLCRSPWLSDFDKDQWIWPNLRATSPLFYTKLYQNEGLPAIYIVCSSKNVLWISSTVCHFIIFHLLIKHVMGRFQNFLGKNNQ